MIEGEPISRPINVSIYFTELLSKKVTANGKKIGKLQDLLIIETLRCPEVTHFVVNQRGREAPLIIPWEKVLSIHESTIAVVSDFLSPYEHKPAEGAIRLQEYILNKKVIDLKDHEIKMVHDLHLIINMFNKLLVFEVDFSNLNNLRRYGLQWLAKFIQSGNEEEVSTIPWNDIQLLPPSPGEEKRGFNIKSLKKSLSRMHPVDLADIIEDMDQDQRVVVFSELDTSMASDTLEEIAPPIQREIVSVLTREKAVAVINEMTPGQAADVLEGIPYDEARDILDTMTAEKAKKVRSILEKSEENILDYTTTRFIMLPPDARVETVRDEYPRLARDKDVIMYLYIVDDSDILRGIVDIKELLQADDDANLIDIMVYEMITLTTESTLKEAAEEFTRYDFRALPVTDPDGKIIGVVPYRDIMKLRHHTNE
ncbi:MAG: CBS domain-containing protein [Methanospirillum sp.]|uniref:magnesium transporter MgtE N-terminal domain-containing protein n=1 Tax=Methanospirillum sp. TaxID=45200 RepID=UPI00236D3656|nr:CBS domain-containing protein [Methanospirillum sp.]MDD1727485.1 CBS domain-containing protein [Methanospirillum sp.]